MSRNAGVPRTVAEAAAFWKRHRLALIITRVALGTIAAAAAVYLAGRAGLLQGINPWNLLGGVLAVIDPGITVATLLRSRVKLKPVIPADDPGHYDLPYAIEGTEVSPGVELVRVPAKEVPGTYPSGASPVSIQRFAYQWTRRPGEHPLSFFEFKIGLIGVRASRNDAPQCVANIEITPIRGESEMLKEGVAQTIRHLSWYSNDKENQLTKTARDERGLTYFPEFDSIRESRTRGLNAFLSNPMATIHEGETEYLILFYMRWDSDRVFIGGEREGEYLRPTTKDCPVEFDAKVEVKGLSAHTEIRVRCTARWDVLTMRQVE